MSSAPTRQVASMSLVERLEMVMRKAGVLAPHGIGQYLARLVSPAALATMAGVVAVWAGSHFFGVGEVADAILLVAGYVTIGRGVWDGGKKLIAFALSTQSARSMADLDRAAAEFVEAGTILGIDVVLGLLFKGRPKGTFTQVYRPELKIPTYAEFRSVMPKAGPMRMYEAKLIFTQGKFAGQGATRLDNVATVGRKFFPEARPVADAVLGVRRTVYHEVIHQRLTQAFSLLGRPALYMKLGAYKRSFILRYIEEAAAEAYALSKTGGARPGELSGMNFPLNGNYGVTLTKMAGEARGVVLGPVVIGGTTYTAAYGMIHADQ